MQIQVHPIHFEDYSGQQFERLCFAYLLRRPDFSSVNWYGQLGQDQGRDIVCDHIDGSTHIDQCANYHRLSKRKAEEDLQKLAIAPRSKNASFCLIAGGSVSGQMKDIVSNLAAKAGFSSCRLWSGIEFEERLRRDTPDLLVRFTQGVAFPELPQELASFAADAHDLTDETIISALTIAFDRPAYKTPFHHESSLPRFRKAIGETIETLNTGLTPSGKVLPSKNNIADMAKRKSIDKLVEHLVALRAAFEDFLRKGEIQHCGCGEVDCPVFMMTEMAAQDMDNRRRKILTEVHKLNSDFDPSFYEL
jgi:hypothetical protein